MILCFMCRAAPLPLPVGPSFRRRPLGRAPACCLQTFLLQFPLRPPWRPYHTDNAPLQNVQLKPKVRGRARSRCGARPHCVILACTLPRERRLASAVPAPPLPGRSRGASALFDCPAPALQDDAVHFIYIQDICFACQRTISKGNVDTCR